MSAAFTALTFLASVPLSTAKTVLTGNLKLLGIDAPAYLQTVAANRIMFAVGVVGLFVTLAILFRPRKRPDFNDVNTWPISVELGPHIAATQPPDGLQIFVQGCRFSNLSTTQSRDLDIELRFPTLDPQKPIFVASTSNSDHRPTLERLKAEGGPIPNGRTMRWLDFPIRVGPNEVVEGQIGFDVQSLGRGHLLGSFDDTVRFLQYEATVIDRRTGQRKTFAVGECYDASLQRAYKGRIGEPRPMCAQYAHKRA